MYTSPDPHGPELHYPAIPAIHLPFGNAYATTRYHPARALV